jgi:Cu(I)/Ag(I) efflux system membrane fusion protein
MKARYVIATFVIALLAAAGGWFAARRPPSLEPTANSTGRRILHYQSAMHPWIKSDKPGNCTICGMKLVPVYEGEKGFESSSNVVSLSSNIINVINVQTDQVRRRPLVRTLRVAGRIEDNDARHRFVSAYIDGRIEKLAINHIGAEVVEGQPLLTFYSPALLTAEHEYLALLRQSQSTNNISLRAEQKNLLSAAAYRLRRLGLTEFQVKELERTEEADTQREIRAPISGTVVQRFIYEGQYVKEGDKLFELSDFSTMWFQFDAYERDLAWLKEGQTVELRTSAMPGKVYSAPIAFIDPNINEITRTARVRVEIENPLVEERKRRELYHRLFADGFVKSEVSEVLAIPRSAIISPGPQAVAYVDQGNGQYEQRLLKLGRLGDDFWEILDGVAEGERVVISGNMLIDAQAQINQSSHGPTPSGSPGDSTAVPHEHSTADGRGALKPAAESTASLNKLTEPQEEAAREFLNVAGGVAQALASDSLDQFNQRAPKLHTVTAALLQAVADSPPWQPLVQKLSATGQLQPAADLPAARKAFLPFSTATADFARKLRSQAEFASLKIYQCPMVDRAIPGAPKIGQWIQTEAPLRNPFFGADMLTCGTEVKP